MKLTGQFAVRAMKTRSVATRWALRQFGAVHRPVLVGVLIVFVPFIVGCGGGGSSQQTTATGATATAPTPPTPATPESQPSLQSMQSASRFAQRATFGANHATIQEIARSGESAWLEQQFQLPIADHASVVDELFLRLQRGDFGNSSEEIERAVFAFRRFAWWHRAVTASDLVRQRVAYALSQIFVVSDKVDVLVVDPYALASYNDVLLQHAFGNFRDLLRDVTLHPAMGVYLSHVNNAKADPVRNTFPDENYAREVMQLFSIGLFLLNVDGTVQRDALGLPIASYNNVDIGNFARVFTGLSYGSVAGGNAPLFGQNDPEFRAPMAMFEAFHDQDEKTLLVHSGVSSAVLPANQSGLDDIEAAIDNLFLHPNVGPFIGRQLIQRLVTSNPSAAYVERVARAFNGETGAARGDMKAVLRAILFDPEAMQPPGDDNTFGKLREPVLRYLAMVRQLNGGSADGFIGFDGNFLDAVIGQHPLSANSVFNFYLPDHSPAGVLRSEGLLAPEFEITTSTTVVGISTLADLIFDGNVMPVSEPFAPVRLDLSEFIGIAGDIDTLLDRIDLVFTYGTLSDETRAAIKDALAPAQDPEFVTRAAINAVLQSPDYAVAL